MASAINRTKTIAITDHGPALSYGINRTSYAEMRDIVDRLKEKYYGVIDILLGVEANILSENGYLDVEEDILNKSDILLAGFHFDIVYKNLLRELTIDLKKNQTLKYILDKSLYEEIRERNTLAIINTLKLYNVDIITHAGDKQPLNIKELASVASKKHTTLEINNFHRYPNVSHLKEAMVYENLSFVVNSDAHRPEAVGTFSSASKIILKAEIDLTRIVNLEEGILHNK